MTRIDHLRRLEQRRVRLEQVLGIVPYVLLAASTALSLTLGGHDRIHDLWTLGLVALTAVWLWFFATRRAPDALFVIGLVVLIVALDTRDVWFAVLFGFTGYLYGWTVLSGLWRFVAVAVTALANMAAIVGVPRTEWDAAAFLGFVVLTVVLVSLFSAVGELASARSAAYQQNAKDLEVALRELELLQERLLAQAREAGVHEERRRLAREIHDTLAQDFVGIVTQLHAAQRGLTAKEPADWTHHLESALQLARNGLEEARRSVNALSPAPLEASVLPEALAATVAGWAQRTGVDAEIATTGTVRHLHPEIEATLIRVAQEGLANVAKHANAGRVGVTLSYMDGSVTLDIRDDGAGFNPAATVGQGYGLTSMRERAARLHGTVEIESTPGAGTAVSVSLPAVPATADVAEDAHDR